MTIHTEIAKPRSGEVPFGFEELFYSRTDKRGVIQAGNDIFQRIAGFDWSEMLGAPHKIVRHPDTPRAVFRILWDALAKGYPMGAYVKNRTKSGDFYWVFAVVMPIEEGFLSLRMKPSSPTFDVVREFYEQFSAMEREKRLDPEDGAGMLRAMARDKGFSNYSSFMAFALGQELMARDRKLLRSTDRQTNVLIEMNRVLERSTQEQRRLLRSFEALQSIPNNMRIVASRLEPSGGPISSISENYKASSAGISDRLRSFVAGDQNMCDRMSRDVAKALFLLGCSRVISELTQNLDAGEPVEGIDALVELALLERLMGRSIADAREAMVNAADLARMLTRASRDIRRQMLGLDTIRVLGRVECGRMRGNGSALSSTIDQLDTFHADIKERLESIMHLSEVIEQSISAYLRSQPG